MFPILFRRIRKAFFLFLPLALLAGYSVHNAFSHYTGVDVPGDAELGSCALGNPPPCHGATPSSSTLLHLFTPAQIFAGQTYRFQISVLNSDPMDIAAGFDVDVDTPAMLDTIAGMNTFQTTPAQSLSTEFSITHSMPQTFKGDSAVWSFLYTAPDSAGIYPIYLAGNAVDGDSATPDTSDHWNVAVQNITVLSSDGVAPTSSPSALQIYPNPASNELFINDGILADEGSYTLTDPAGRVVLFGHQIPLGGNHSIDVSTLSAGAYILSVQPRNGQSFSRSIVIQR
jgi:Secretion system C-terminal sorting domain